MNASHSEAVLSKRHQEGPSLSVAAIEFKPAEITTHTVAEAVCQSGRLRNGAFAEAKKIEIGMRARFGLSVPLRWRPAHGGSTSKTSSTLVLRKQIMYASSQKKRLTLALAQYESREMQLVFPQPPNPSIEGTANGGARLRASPSPVAPLPAPHVKRYAPGSFASVQMKRTVQRVAVDRRRNARAGSASQPAPLWVRV
jgi:hypothetical protein